MTRLDSERVEALFAEALARPPERWAAYLETAVADAEVRLEVLSLLLAHQRKGRFDSLADHLRGDQLAAASVQVANFMDRVTAALAERYHLERELGRGGMATVWLAHDLKHDRRVALKVLRPEVAAALGSERFLREIIVTARLHHSHILALLDSGEADGVLYYAMPYVEGESLRERLTREKQLPLEDALQIAHEVADALGYAHSHDVVHRDIKPENILLESGHALVADFGIARAITTAGAERLTETGIAVGTPAYMSPEQGAGQHDLDGRSDLYSLGCVLYEMLAGHPPFTGTTAQEILARHSLDAVPRLSAARVTIPAPIEAAVLKLLEKAPADRFRRASQFVDALGDRAPALPGQVRRPGRHWVRMGLAVVLIGALTWVATRAVTVRAGRGHAAQPEIVQLTFSGNARTPALSSDGQRLAYSTRQCDADGVCTMDVIVQDMDGAGRATVARGLGDVFDIQWTADGRYLVINGWWPGANEFGPFAIPALGGREPRYLGCCRGVIVRNTDTVLVTEHPGSDSANWVRWVTIADGVTHDSLLMPKEAGAVTITVDPLSSPQRLLRKTWSAAQVLVTTLDRSGHVLDSLRLESRRLRVLQPSPDGTGMLVGRVIESVPAPSDARMSALVDLVKYPLGDNGRIGTRPDTIWQRLELSNLAPTMMSTARTGTLVYASGRTGYELWLLRRGETGFSFVRRRLTSGTGYLDGKPSPDGGRIGIMRGVIVRDRQLQQFSTMSADSGPEKLIGVPQEVLGWEWSPDGSGVLIVIPQGRDSVAFRAVALPGGGSRLVSTIKQGEGETAGAYFSFAPLLGSGLAVSVAARSRPPYTPLRRIGVPGFRDTILEIPAEYQGISSLSPSPDGRAVAIVGPNRKLDSVLVSRVSLKDGHADRVAAFLGDITGDPPVWSADGSLIVSVRPDQRVVWYRVPARGGRPLRLGTAPWNTAGYRWSADGRRILATVRNDAADVYTMRNFGELLNR